MSHNNSWNVKGKGKYNDQFTGLSGKIDKEEKV